VVKLIKKRKTKMIKVQKRTDTTNIFTKQHFAALRLCAKQIWASPLCDFARNKPGIAPLRETKLRETNKPNNKNLIRTEATGYE
jgi:hypothetical protein